VVETFDVTADVVISGSDLTIDPTSDLTPGVGYYVQIADTAIDDLAGNNFAGIADTTTWNFTTDGTPPSIATLSPVDDATDVPVGSNLVATFDEDVMAGTGNINLHLASDDSVVETFDVASSSQLTFSGTDLTIDPTSNLEPTTGYYVTIAATAVEDLSGNAFAGLAGNAAWNFTAAAYQPITAVNSGNFGGSAPGVTVTETIDVGAGADMLIVMTSTELGSGSPVMTVTYGGVAMNLAVGNRANSGIWYLDLATPGISGTDVVVDMSGYATRNGFAAGWVSINGSLGTGDSIVLHSTGTSAAQTNTVDLTTTLETFNVVNFNANNTSKPITVDSPDPTVIYTDTNIGSAEGAAAYDQQVDAGTSTYQWTLGGLTPPASDYRRIDAAAFAVEAGAGGTAFENWADTGTLGTVTFDGDTNNDGVRDGMAFLLGAANPDDDATGLLPTVSEDGSGGLVMTFSCLPVADRGDAKLHVEHSSDLGVSDVWLATADQVPDTTDAVADNGVTFVVTPGSPTNGVAATIASTEAAGDKLFGRLLATEN
jgi:hypothetical protein